MIDAADRAGVQVTAVITTYNEDEYLPGALASVAAQSALPAQVLVVDDGSSTDGAADICRAVSSRSGLAVEYVRRENGGVSAARNEGLMRATKPYIAYLDADDRWFPTHIARKLRRLEALDERFSSAYDGFIHVDSHGLARRTPPVSALEGPITGELMMVPGGAAGLMQCTLHRTAALREIGGFDVGLQMWEDVDLMLRLGKAGYSISGSAEPTTRRLLREASLSHHDPFKALHASDRFADKAEREGLLPPPLVLRLRREIRLFVARELLQGGRAAQSRELIDEAFRLEAPAKLNERVLSALASRPLAPAAPLLAVFARSLRQLKLRRHTMRVRRRHPEAFETAQRIG